MSLLRLAASLFVSVILLGGGGCVRAQEESDPMFPGRRKEDPPRSIRETLSKMRIDKDKKDFNEMVRRGDDAAKISSDLKEISAAGQQDQIANIGKLVKKIRDELGAQGPDDDPDAVPTTQTDAI